MIHDTCEGNIAALNCCDVFYGLYEARQNFGVFVADGRGRGGGERKRHDGHLRRGRTAHTRACRTFYTWNNQDNEYSSIKCILNIAYTFP